MKFSIYMKRCRIQYSLTQKDLIEKLYCFNEVFKTLDNSSLSRWERGTTQPSSLKQVLIVKFFSQYSTKLFSCFDNTDKILQEDKICYMGIQNLIGNAKEHILKFPSTSFSIDDITIKNLHSEKEIDTFLTMPHSVIRNMTNNYHDISLKQLKKLASHPSNLFLVAEHQKQFFGMFFVLRLKPESFKAMMHFEKEVGRLSYDDLASFEEEACCFILSFFAFNTKVTALLYLRFYAHLISHQETLLEVGTTPLLDGAKRLVEKMNLKSYKEIKSKERMLSAYKAPLSEVLLNEDVFKMLFKK